MDTEEASSIVLLSSKYVSDLRGSGRIAATQDYSSHSMIGTKLGHFTITAHLGSRGMGDVYQATDSKLGRTVAIKLLPEAFTHDTERVTAALGSLEQKKLL